jgi:phage-related minor tail protein
MANPAAIENRLAALETALDKAGEDIAKAVTEYEEVGIAAIEAQITFEVEYATVYLSMEPKTPEHIRKQVAIQQTAELRKSWLLAAHMVKTADKAVMAKMAARSSADVKVGAARTLAANLRSYIDLDKTGHRP